MRRSPICLLLTLTLAGCLGLNDRAIHLAGRHGLVSAVIDGTQYRHQIFYQLGTDRNSLFVFIDGDGSPWSRAGAEPARDPTPHRAIALELATNTPHSVLYLGRPCYFTVHSDSACTARIWTSDRYSKSVVESLAAVVNRFAAEYRYSHTVLIGYSGGGTLAALMAQYIASVSVVTIAANLDVAAWASFHNYLPLSAIINPPPPPPPIRFNPPPPFGGGGGLGGSRNPKFFIFLNFVPRKILGLALFYICVGVGLNGGGPFCPNWGGGKGFG